MTSRNDTLGKGASLVKPPAGVADVAGPSVDAASEGQVLKFGDEILLHCTTSKGYVAGHLSSREDNVIRVEPDAIQNYASAITASALVIVTKNKSKRQRAFQRLTRSIQRHDPLCDDDEALRLAKEQQGGIYAAAEMEIEDNLLEMRRRYGDVLYYGQEVQLFSKHFRKYVHVSDTNTSELEPSNLRVEMGDIDGPTAVFKIMPRFKVRAEGDPVRVEDQVTLESLTTPGQYLHTSVADMRGSAGIHEINVSVTRSAYVVRLFKSSAHVSEKIISGNDIIQLFHKEIGGYVAAEGASGGHNHADGFVEDIHVRVRLPDDTRPSREFPPTSAVSYFQVERVETHEGFPLQWNDSVRFKHYTTSMYIRCDPTSTSRTIDGNIEKLSLSLSKVRDEHTLFRLEPVIEENEYVRSGMYSRIQHVRSGYWLHASAMSEYNRHESEMDYSDLGPELRDLASRVSKIKWDNAPLKQLSLSKERLFDDAFVTTLADFHQVFHVNYVNGMIPILREYVNTRKNTSEEALSHVLVNRTVKALQELMRFCFIRGQPQKMRQKIFRNLRVVELLIEVLKAPFSGQYGLKYSDLADPSMRTDKTKKICTAAGQTLQAYLKGDSRKNEVYISRHVPYFHFVLGSPLAMEEMYTELLRDNLTVISCISQHEINRVIDLLAKGTKNHNFLNWLGVICESDEAPIIHNQDFVAKRLLEDHEGVLYRTALKRFSDPSGKMVAPTEQGVDEVAVSRDSGKTWERLRVFVASALNEDDAESSPEYLFFKAQLDLLGALANGRNEKVIALITEKKGYVSWNECFSTVRNRFIPWSLRSKYVELIHNLFVDVGDNVDVLSEPQLTFGYGEIQATNREPYHDAVEEIDLSLSGARMPFFAPLNDWIVSVLVSMNGRMVASDLQQNLFLSKMLALLLALLRFGYYAHKDHIDALMTQLQSILDGSDDVPTRARNDSDLGGAGKRTRFASVAANFKQSRKGKAVEEVVGVSPELVYQSTGRFEKGLENEAIMDVKLLVLQSMDAMFNLVATIRVQMLMFDFICLRVNEEENKTLLGKLNANDFRALSALYRASHDHSIADADTLDALVQVAGKDSNIADHAEHAVHYIQKLVHQTSYVHSKWDISMGGGPNTLPATMLDLVRYDHPMLVLEAMNVLVTMYSSQEDMLTNSRHGLILLNPESVRLATRLRKDASFLREITERNISGPDFQKFKTILADLQAKCRLPNELSTPHKINQAILFNSHIVGLLLNVIKSEFPQSSATLQAVFEFLTAIAFENEIVQRELFDYLNDMLRCEASDQDIEQHRGTYWVNAMAQCIGEIFRGNRHTCLRVLPSQIEHMVDLLSKFGVDAPDLLVALKSVAKLEELNIPLQRNQNVIMKAIALHRTTLIDIALIDDVNDAEMNRKRMDMLRGSESFGGPSLRQYHLNLIELLATCAEGDNPLIESMCQSIFTIDELLDVLSDKHIKPIHKTSYIKFLLWVYLNSEAVIEITKDLSHDSSEQGRRFYGALVLLAETKLVPMADAKIVRGVDDENFIFQAFLPILNTTAAHFYVATQPQSTAKLIAIGQILSKYTVAVIPSLFEHAQIKALAACLSSISGICRGSITTAASDAVGTKLLAEEAGVDDSPAVLAYLKAHSEEERLNQYFRTYIHVLKAICTGHNTVGAQLSHRVAEGKTLRILARTNEQYGETYCEPPGDDQALPLGREFQAFISLFTVPSEDSRVTCKMNDEVKMIVKHLLTAKSAAGTLHAEQHERQNVVLTKLLQVLRGILHNERAISAEHENEPAYTKMQDTAVEFGSVLAVSKLLSSEDDNVVREGLACLIQILECGNKNAQKAFMNHFLETREETFFNDIQSRLRRSTDGIVEERILQKQRTEEAERQKLMIGTMTLKDKFKASNVIAGSGGGAGPGGGGGSIVPKVTTYNQVFQATGNFENQSDGTTLNPMHASKKVEEESVDDAVKDEGNIELVLRMLQLMCEGHNTELQDYLRTQPDNIRSIDLVGECVKFADTVTEEIDINNVELVIQSIDTLVEFCQGCRGNQQSVFNNHAMDSINRVIRDCRVDFRASDFRDYPDKADHTGPWVVQELHLRYAKLHTACAKLVLSMLEDSDAETKQMAKEIQETLDIRTVLQLIDEYYYLSMWDRHGRIKWPKVDEEEEDVPNPRVVGYAWFNVLALLSDFTDVNYNEFNGKERKGYCEFRKDDLTIEIARDGGLRKIHFPGAQWAKDLRPEVKHELNWHVERSSPTDKIRDFVDRCRTIIADVLYERTLAEQSKFAGAIIAGKPSWRKLMMFLTFLINLLMLIFWEANPGDLNEVIPVVPDWFIACISVLGAFHLLGSVLVCLSYSLVHPPWFRELLNDFPTWQSTLFGELKSEHENRTRLSPLYPLSLYHYLLVLFSILGLIYHGYFFSFHLLHVVVDNDILERVVSAVTRNGSSLLQVAGLMLVIIYIYTLAAFAFYREAFAADEGAYCQNLGQCFVTSVRIGMMSGGGLGEALPLSPQYFSFFGPGVKTIFDLSYFILITVIALNVVFGIIVDTFSELRDEKQEIQESMTSECFICSRKAYEFDRYGTPFKQHIKEEHHQWNYLYYMLYLQDIDPNDYDSNQQYFADALNHEQEATVFPINKAQCLAKMEDEEGDAAAVNLAIRDQLAALLTKVEKLEKASLAGGSNKANAPRAGARTAGGDSDDGAPTYQDYQGFESGSGKTSDPPSRLVSADGDADADGDMRPRADTKYDFDL